MDVPKTSLNTRLPIGRKALLWALPLAVVVIASLVWLALGSSTPKLDGVQQVVVMRGDLQPTLDVLGTIRPIHMQTVAAQTAGRIISIDVKPGLPVHKGATLLVLANPEVRSDLATARMKYAQARSQVDIARAQAGSDIASARTQLLKATTAEAYARSHYRATATVNKLGAVSRMQLEEMKSKLDMAAADTAAAKTALDAMRKVAAARVRGKVEESHVLKQELDRQQQQVDALTVRAPAQGFIADKSADAGTNVAAGAALLSFVDTSGYYVRLNIPEDASGAVRVGDTVSIATGDTTLDGEISRVAPLSKKGYVSADASFSNKPAHLPSIDATVQVRIHTHALHDVLYVRAPSDINGDQIASVYVVHPHSHEATRRKVSFGVRVGHFVTVLDGLAKGDHILTGVSKPDGPTQVRF